MLATQNPVEFHGTYPLPEAQLDRFGLRIGLGYPAAEDELEVLFSQAERHPLESVEPVLSAADVVALQAATRAGARRALARALRGRARRGDAPPSRRCSSAARRAAA